VKVTRKMQEQANHMVGVMARIGRPMTYDECLAKVVASAERGVPNRIALSVEQSDNRANGYRSNQGVR
jgi:hypothetical protein